MPGEKCPHCSALVLTQFDQTCPTCNAPLNAAAPTAAPGGNAQTDDREPLFSTIPPPTAVNPYRSPKYFSDDDSQKLAGPSKSVWWVLFGFDGRIPRRVYWMASIGTTIVFYMCAFAVAQAAGPNSDHGNLLMLALYIPFTWISLAITVKRWHDRDKSGWWILIGIIPIIGPLWQFIETGCLRGTVGPNSYGPDPT